LSESPEANWHYQRVLKLCEKYERIYSLFSEPARDNLVAYMHFAEEVAESVQFRKGGGED
jgi:hypothetical protein